MDSQCVLDNLWFAYMNDLLLSRFLCGMISDWFREQGREEEADLMSGPVKHILVYYCEPLSSGFIVKPWTDGNRDPWCFSVWKEEQE